MDFPTETMEYRQGLRESNTLGSHTQPNFGGKKQQNNLKAPLMKALPKELLEDLYLEEGNWAVGKDG